MQLAAGATCLLAGALAVAVHPDPVAAAPGAGAGVLVMTLGWAVGARAASRGGSARALAVVLLAGAAARALLLAPGVPLSDDLYRYLWEGRVGNAGLDPFVHAPHAPELDALADPVIRPRVNHPDIPTIYPPVAQLLFRAQAAVAYRPRTPRVTAVLADLAGVLLLAALLRRRGRPAALAVALAWCPLAILESAGGGHVDATGAALLVGALLAADRSRAAPAGALLAASALVKPMAVLLVPRLLAPGPMRRRLALAGGATLVSFVCIPYLDAGASLVTGLRAYAEHWRFHDALYTPLTVAGIPPRTARWILAAAGVVAAFAVIRRPRDPLAAAGLAVAAALALSPTVHPWYGVWLVPLLPFLPRAVLPAGAVLVALLPLAYVTPWRHAISGAWDEPIWPRAITWGAVALALACGPRLARRGAAADEAPARAGVVRPGAAPRGGWSRGSSARRRSCRRSSR